MSNITVLATVSSQVDAGGRVSSPPVVLPRLLPRQLCTCGTYVVWDTLLGQYAGTTYPSIEAAKSYIDGLLDRTQRLAGMSEMEAR